MIVESHSQRIVVVANSASHGAELKATLSTAGYETEIFNDIQTFREVSLREVPPAVVIASLSSVDHVQEAAKTISELRSQWCPELAVIFLLPGNFGMAVRLAVLRAGAARMLQRPVSNEALLGAVSDLLAQGRPAEPYRVLLVDDSPALLMIGSEILRHAGMEVMEISDPTLVVQALENFDADVLVLDMYMPQCTGLELLAILREDERYALKPVLFLSAETNPTRQFRAMSQGGDFFLTKPIVAEHLLAAVTHYATRARLMRKRQLDSSSASTGIQLDRVAREIPSDGFSFQIQQQALDRHAIVSIADASGRITYANDLFCSISGFSREELIGKNHRIVKSGDHPPEFYREMWETISNGNIWQGEVCNRRKGGGRYWVSSTIVPVVGKSGKPSMYVSIRTEITRLKQAEEALAVAKEHAEDASRAKSEFLASISHELRTPLNAILGFGQLLASDSQLSADARENVQEIAQAGNHLLSLVNGLIDLARIESGKLALSMEAVGLNSVIGDSVSMVAPIAASRGITIVNEPCQCRTIAVLADYVRLRQVLINFLSNAIKYNKPQGLVTIICEKVDTSHADRDGLGVVRISIADTGMGIPLDKQSRLFNPFDRLGSERGNVEGAGIGLVITQRIVEAMGGHLGFISEEGKGSTFWVDLPVSSVDVSESQGKAPESASPNISSDHYDSESSGRRIRILYVEDNPGNVRLMQQFFSRRPDIELVDADTAESGISLARTKLPDLIFMDINLPGISGFDALEILRSDARTRNIPVIAISANAMTTEINRGLEAGFVDYLTKPVSMRTLFGAIDKVLSDETLPSAIAN